MKYSKEVRELIEDLDFNTEIGLLDLLLDLFSRNEISITETNDNRRIITFNSVTYTDWQDAFYDEIMKIIDNDDFRKKFEKEEMQYCKYIHKFEHIIKYLNIIDNEEQDISLFNISVFGKEETTLNSFNDKEIELLAEFIYIKLSYANKILELLKQEKKFAFEDSPFHLPYKEINIVELAILAKRLGLLKIGTIKDIIDKICDRFNFPIIDNADELIEEVKNRKNIFPTSREFIAIINNYPENK